MNHAITVGGLFSVVVILAGLGALAFGALMVFAGGMSDAPASGESTSRTGCFVAVLGIAMLVGGLMSVIA